MRLWLLLLVPLLVPSALAQDSFTVTAGKPAGPLEPGGGEAEIPVRVEVPCETLSTANHPVELSIARQPAWVATRLEPARLHPPLGASCAAAWSGNATLYVRADEPAPALREEPIAVTARLGNAERNANAHVKAAYKPDLLVEADETSRTGEPQSTVSFEVRLTNRANGPTKVGFDVAATPGFMAPVPGSVVLQSPLDGQQSTGTIPVSVVLPYRNGRVDEQGVVTVRVTPSYALDPQFAGAAQTLTFRVHAVGTYVPVSGAALATLALALAPALVLRRR